MKRENPYKNNTIERQKKAYTHTHVAIIQQCLKKQRLAKKPRNLFKYKSR